MTYNDYVICVIRSCFLQKKNKSFMKNIQLGAGKAVRYLHQNTPKPSQFLSAYQ